MQSLQNAVNAKLNEMYPKIIGKVIEMCDHTCNDEVLKDKTMSGKQVFDFKIDQSPAGTSLALERA